MDSQQKIACHICGKFIKPSAISLHNKKCKRKWTLEQKELPADQREPCPDLPADHDEIVQIAKQMEKNAIENPLDPDDDYESEMRLTEYNERILQSFEVPDVVRASLS